MSFNVLSEITVKKVVSRWRSEDKIQQNKETRSLATMKQMNLVSKREGNKHFSEDSVVYWSDWEDRSYYSSL